MYLQQSFSYIRTHFLINDQNNNSSFINSTPSSSATHLNVLSWCYLEKHNIFYCKSWLIMLVNLLPGPKCFGNSSGSSVFEQTPPDTTVQNFNFTFIPCSTHKSEIFAIKLSSICKNHSPCWHVETKRKCFCSKEGLIRTTTKHSV